MGGRKPVQQPSFTIQSSSDVRLESGQEKVLIFPTLGVSDWDDVTPVKGPKETMTRAVLHFDIDKQEEGAATIWAAAARLGQQEEQRIMPSVVQTDAAGGAVFEPVLADANDDVAGPLRKELKTLQRWKQPQSDILDMLPGFTKVSKNDKHKGIAYRAVTSGDHVIVTFLGPATDAGGGSRHQVKEKDGPQSPVLVLLIKVPVGASVTLKTPVVEIYDTSQY
ncbi:hypothetical protein K4F52_005723 [Lecanicillium sp. MT-2017a]|nr:hypothetical protein K4F52_005723 [Lecanicillium sp. MT-2017a]